MARRISKPLEAWEIALIKTMLGRGWQVQHIQAFFTRPARTVNHARVIEIREGSRGAEVASASEDELDAFLEAWPLIDEPTGLHLQDDELVVKAREAMIAAVQTFNSGGLHFRTELFIVTSVIAWTYLLHAYYQQEGIDFRHRDKDGNVLKTKHGSDKFWELGHCLKVDECPVESGVVNNLEFLLELRHEIEHQSTSRIDDATGAELQACCLNFNDTLKELFGAKLGLENRLSVALQFAGFDSGQTDALIRSDLPEAIEAVVADFNERLTLSELRDPRFRYLVSLVPTISNNATKAHQVVTVAKAGTPEASDAGEVVIKETERPKYRAKDVIERVHEEGFTGFNHYDHRLLWTKFDAKNPGTGYSIYIEPTWYWYDRWLDKVLDELRNGWTRDGEVAVTP